MSKMLASIIAIFWLSAIAYMLWIGISFIISEPSVGLMGILGFLTFLGSGIQIIFPNCIEAFAKGRNHDGS